VQWNDLRTWVIHVACHDSSGAKMVSAMHPIRRSRPASGRRGQFAPVASERGKGRPARELVARLPKVVWKRVGEEFRCVSAAHSPTKRQKSFAPPRVQRWEFATPGTM